MTTRRVQVINEVVVDASQAEQGFRTYRQASREAAQATAQQTEATERESAALQRLKRQIDPAAAAQDRMTRGSQVLHENLRRGAISYDRYTDLVEKLENKYGAQARAAERVEHATRNVGAEIDRAGRFARAAAGAFAALAAAMAVREVVAFGVAALGTANQLADLSDTLGIATENLQIYRRMAGAVGVEQAQLDRGFQQFIQRVGEARQGTGELAATAERLNIDLSNNEAALRQVFQRMAETRDEADRAAIAVDAFGESGVGIARMAENFADLRAEAQALGGIMSNELADRAAAVNTRFSQLGDALSGAFQTAFIEQTIAAFEAFQVELGDSTDLATEFGELAGTAVGNVLRVATELMAFFNDPAVRSGISSFFDVIKGGSQAATAVVLTLAQAVQQVASLFTTTMQEVQTQLAAELERQQRLQEQIEDAISPRQRQSLELALEGSTAEVLALETALEAMRRQQQLTAEQTRRLNEVTTGNPDGAGTGGLAGGLNLVGDGAFVVASELLSANDSLARLNGTARFTVDVTEEQTRAYGGAARAVEEIGETADVTADRVVRASRESVDAVEDYQRTVESISKDVSGILADAIFGGTASAADAAAQYLRRTFQDLVVTPVIRPTKAKVMRISI